MDSINTKGYKILPPVWIMKKQAAYILILAAIIVGIVLVSSLNFDINRDGVINITDLQILASHFEGKLAYNSSFDINGNGKVDLFDVVAEAKQINTSSGASSAPIPPPVGSSNIVFDTRAGGTQDIQAASVVNVTDADDAFTINGRKTYVQSKNPAGPTVYPTDFVTNLDGKGTHAYRFNWMYLANYSGNASSCYNQNGEQNAMIDLNPKYNSSAPIYLQWKTWFGRTATGGGMGNSTIGSFNHTGGAGGHKMFIMYRQSGGGTLYRTYFGYSGADGLVLSFRGGWGDTSSGGPGTREADLGLTPHNLNDYNNQVLTWTLYIKPESAAGASDGAVGLWLNNKRIYYYNNVETGNTGFYEHQFGGPTFICPQQDQTQYYWDFVEWAA